MKKGFTLIELLAVIVILAILALIVSPIISGVISDAKKAAAERSMEGYIKAVEFAQIKYQGQNAGKKTDDLSVLSVELSNGNSIKNQNVAFTSDGIVSNGIATIDDYYCTYEQVKGASCIILVPTDSSCFVTEEVLGLSTTYSDADKCMNFWISNNMGSLQNGIFGCFATSKVSSATCLTEAETFIDKYDKIEIDKLPEAERNLTYNNLCKKTAEINNDPAAYWNNHPDVYNALNSNGVLVSDASSKIAITNYTCANRNIVIPRDINGKTITDIATNAFKGKNLQTVIFMGSINNIQKDAFTNNSITQVYLPSTVSLRDNDELCSNVSDAFDPTTRVYLGFTKVQPKICRS